MPFIPVADPLTPAWLTAVLRGSGALSCGEVREVEETPTGAFNSATSYLQVSYSLDAPPDLTTRLVLKRNITAPWAVEAGAQEVAFYQLIGALRPAPPVIVPCYAAAYDAASGDSYLLLHDLSATHAHPISRDQQVSIVEAVPSARAIEQVTEALAQHHAYWWDHPLLAADHFDIGYWSRNAERFALYLQRRRTAWQGLVTHEGAWFPDDLRALYGSVFEQLEHHWRIYLEPRFRNHTNLTLVHGDTYFTNFLCPNDPAATTYLLDWQSPGVDIGGYDLANLCATFWTPEQRNTDRREEQILRHYHTSLQAHGVKDYTWDDLLIDYRTGLIYWLLVPLQDRHDGASKDYWWPKMQCLAAAFREWRCGELLETSGSRQGAESSKQSRT